GLRAGTEWWVNTTTTSSPRSGAVSLTMALANGSYVYSATTTGPGPLSAHGVFTVDGASTNVTVTFAPGMYPVSFTELGLPAGTTWSVTVNGTPLSSKGPGITFMEPNGTYAVIVGGVPGYAGSPSSMSVMVAGNAVARSVQFARSGAATGNTIIGLPMADAQWLLVGIGVAVVASAIVLVVRRGRRPGKASPRIPREKVRRNQP
ncbi:MAG: hypothetical protein ACYDFT_07775, partial [Thermoplasmata archaeon]